ncbi:MAG: hypothetical protein JRF33_12825 [Deltaproteobacteria bacterium]|nr:hypothetical protein [Deltaproteobacteria bacterium]
MKLFIFDRQLKVGLFVLLGLSFLLWLTPAFPLPEGRTWGLLGEDWIEKNALDAGGLGAAEFDQQARNQSKGLRVIFVGDEAPRLAGNLPKDTQIENLLPEEIFSPFRRLCGGKAKSLVFVDADGQSGFAWRAALLYSLNDCPATWLQDGVQGYLKWKKTRGEKGQFAPSLRPPGTIPPPIPQVKP